MGKEKTLNIGFIGAGANTRSMHIPGFQKIEGVSLHSVANRTEASSRAVAKESSIAQIASNWQAVVSDPEVDAVCIGTWPNTHAQIAIAALEAGKHVLCEARMARDLGEAREMLAAAKAHPNQVFQIVPAPFSLDFDQRIREQITSGAIGRLLEVRVAHTGGQYADPDTPMIWRQDVALSGKNILSMGIMHETILRWVGEDPMWLIADGEVFQAERPTGEGPQRAVVDIPDSLSILGRFEGSGARFIYHFSAVESGRPRMEFRINGTEGALRFDAANKQLMFAKAGATEEQRLSISRAESRGWQVEADFIRSIRTGAPVTLTHPDEALRYMHFTEMVDRSWRNGSTKVTWRECMGSVGGEGRKET